MKNIARLVGNVKKLQREKTGDYPAGPVDVSQVLNDVIARYSSVPGRDVRINFRPAEQCHVLANELITDLYANIVGNAIKHSRGQVQIDVGMDKVHDDDREYCRVIIEDTGPGITDEMKRLLTTRECMTGPATRQRPGTVPGQDAGRRLHGKLRIEDRCPVATRKVHDSWSCCRPLPRSPRAPRPQLIHRQDKKVDTSVALCALRVLMFLEIPADQPYFDQLRVDAPSFPESSTGYR